MILEVTGTFPNTGQSGALDGRLGEAHIESQVYSKSRARAEFERFLRTVDLPELSWNEPEDERSETQKSESLMERYEG